MGVEPRADRCERLAGERFDLLVIGGGIVGAGIAATAARIGLRCRFTPTCSRYGETVIARDGAVRGGWKTVKRIARCGPWTPLGTVDPP